MNLRKSFGVVSLATILALTTPTLSSGKDLRTLGDFQERYSKYVQGYESEARRGRGAIKGSYLSRLRMFLAHEQRQGDLEGYIMLTNEIATVNSAENFFEEDTSEQIFSLRRRYMGGWNKVEEKRAKKISQITESYVKALNGLKRELTKEGRIEEAAKARAEDISALEGVAYLESVEYLKKEEVTAPKIEVPIKSERRKNVRPTQSSAYPYSMENVQQDGTLRESEIAAIVTARAENGLKIGSKGGPVLLKFHSKDLNALYSDRDARLFAEITVPEGKHWPSEDTLEIILNTGERNIVVGEKEGFSSGTKLIPLFTAPFRKMKSENPRLENINLELIMVDGDKNNQIDGLGIEPLIGDKGPKLVIEKLPVSK